MTKPDGSKPDGGKQAPFADEASSFELAGLTVENGTASIAVYGQTNLTRDKEGLARARALLAFLQDAVKVLEADKALPDQVPPPSKAATVKNPFS